MSIVADTLSLVLSSTLAAAAPADAEGALAAQARSPLEIEVGGSVESVTGQSDWQEYYVLARYRFGPRQSVYARWLRAHRYDVSDTQGTLGVTFPVGDPWTVTLEGAMSPQHHFLPRWSTMGHLHTNLGQGWGVQVGAGISEYGRVTPVTVTRQYATLERYFSAYRLAYTLSGMQVEDRRSGIGHQVAGSWYYMPGAAVTVAVGTGQEVIAFPSADDTRVEVDRTNSAAIWGNHPIQPGLHLVYSFHWHQQGDRFDRTGARVGFRQTF
jgi:YaiO family outer membrane protein